MKIIEYFMSDNKEHWNEQIAIAEWGAAKFLLKLLNDIKRFNELLGSGGKLFLLVDGENIVSFMMKICFHGLDFYIHIRTTGEIDTANSF